MKIFSINKLIFTTGVGAALIFGMSLYAGLSERDLECQLSDSHDEFLCTLTSFILTEKNSGSDIRLLELSSAPAAGGSVGATIGFKHLFGGGARIGSDGKIEVLNEAGQITHRDFSPLLDSHPAALPPSIAVVTKNSSEPLAVDMRPPLSSMNTPDFLFLGNIDRLSVDVSGRDGRDGGSLNQAAAFQLLTGQLGQGESSLALVDSMNLTTQTSAPSIPTERLVLAGGGCEAIPGGYTDLQATDDADTLKASLEKAREQISERLICDREVSKELSVSTVCRRPPEISRTLSCSYPDLVRSIPSWRRPTEQKKVSITCANTVPEGEWQGTCINEEYAALGSAIRTNYITLAPSKSIEEGHKKFLSHHWADNNVSTCNSMPLAYELGAFSSNYSAYVDSTEFAAKLYPTDENYGSETYVDPVFSEGCSSTKNFSKMDKLSFTGAYVYENSRYAPAGSGDGDDAPVGDATDLTRLSYWRNKSITGTDRLAWDNLRDDASENISPRYYQNDPDNLNDLPKSVAERSAYFDGLETLGFGRPTINDATISYDKITVTKNSYSIDLRSILCNLVGTTTDTIASQSSGPKCDQILGELTAGNTALGLENNQPLRFREYIRYDFSGLRAGLALRKKSGSALEADHYTSALSEEEISFEPRLMLLPGKGEVDVVKEFRYCESIAIDEDPVLITTNTPYDFIGPEKTGGYSLNIYGDNGAKEDYQFDLYNRSVESDENQAPQGNIHAWSSSFLKINDLTPSAADCQLRQVSHKISDQQKRLLQDFNNAQMVAVVAKGSSIYVFHSPIKIPNLNSTLYINESVSPGLYMPRVHVGPAHASGLENAMLDPANSKGFPARKNFVSADDQIAATAQVSMITDFSAGIEYYAIPSEAASPSEINLAAGRKTSLPYSGFSADQGRSLTNNTEPHTQAEVRAKVDLSADRSGVRFIKTLRSLDLGLAAGADGFVVTRQNQPKYGDTILATIAGTRASSPATTCDAGSMVSSARYPTKLISRTSEPAATTTETSGGDYPENGDSSIVTSLELMDGGKSAANYRPDRSNYFSRAFIPTTMAKDHQGNLIERGTGLSHVKDVAIIDEPVNLVQDYNSWLAQLHSNLRRAYRNNVSNGGVKKKLKEINNNTHYMPQMQPNGLIPSLSETERDCLEASPDGPDYCLEFDRSMPARLVRPQFSLRWPQGSYEYERPGAPGEPSTFDHLILGTNAAPVRPIRPFEQYGRDDHGFDLYNHPCEYPPGVKEQLAADPSDLVGWTQRVATDGNYSNPAECWPSHNFVKGHFFPFARTRLPIFSQPGLEGPYKDLPADSNDYTHPFNARHTMSKFDANLGSSFGLPSANLSFGGADSSGAASSNPTGFGLAPVGIEDLELLFQRFYVEDIKNCKVVRVTGGLLDKLALHGVFLSVGEGLHCVRGGNGWENYTFGPKTDSIKLLEMAWHMFTAKKQINSQTKSINPFGHDPGGDFRPESFNDDSIPRHGKEDGWYVEKDLTRVGMSAHLIEECTPNFDQSSTLRPRAANGSWRLGIEGWGSLSDWNDVPGRKESIFRHDYSELGAGYGDELLTETPDSAFMPMGFSFAGLGGLYFGPMYFSEDAAEFLPLAETDRNNALIISKQDQTERSFAQNRTFHKIDSFPQAAGTPNFHHVVSSLSTAQDAAIIEPLAGASGWDLVRANRAVYNRPRLVTIGRAVKDAEAESSAKVAGEFGYESPLAFSPEVLAAFFIHSDSGVLQGDLDPYGSGLANPQYFTDIIDSTSNLLSTRQRSKIVTHLLRPSVHATDSGEITPALIALKNCVDSYDDGGVSFGASGRYVCQKDRTDATMSFSWQPDLRSLHTTVVTMNTLATEQVDGNLVPAEAGVDAIRSGILVKYGEAGYFGKASDQLDFDRTVDGETTQVTIRRSEGVTTPALVGQPLSLQPTRADEQQNSLSHYIVPGEMAAQNGRPPYYFANYLCSGNYTADDTIVYKLGGTGSGEDSCFAPYDRACKGAASGSTTDLLGGGGGGSAYLNTRVDCTESGAADYNSTLKLDMIYSKLIRRNVELSETNPNWYPAYQAQGLTDPADPPVCATPQYPDAVAAAMVFEAEGSVATETFLAINNWTVESGETIDPDDPVCPASMPLAISTVYASLFADPNSCYDELTGEQYVDTRASSARTATVCPGPYNGSPRKASVIDATPSAYRPKAQPAADVFTPPSGDKAVYNIFQGERAGESLSMKQIRAEATRVSSCSQPPCFEPDLGNYSQLRCDVVAYDAITGQDMTHAPEGRDVLRSRWSLLEIERRYGSSDPFYVVRGPTQVFLSDGSSGLNISDFAPSCNDDGGEVQSSSDEPAPPSAADFTYSSGYRWSSGAGSSITVRQPTPWSTELADGQGLSCAIFNDPNILTGENVFDFSTTDEQGNIAVNSGAREFVVAFNPQNYDDSSLNNPSHRFVTGGSWQPVGAETLLLTRLNSVEPVECFISKTSSSAADYCTDTVSLVYESVQGFQLTIKAENGGHGGNGGRAQILTTRPIGELEIKSQAGRGGRVGGSTLSGAAGLSELVCQKIGGDIVSPQLKIYRFNEPSISIAPAQPGLDGSSRRESKYGWGVMPEAIEFLQDQVAEPLE